MRIRSFFFSLSFFLEPYIGTKVLYVSRRLCLVLQGACLNTHLAQVVVSYKYICTWSTFNTVNSQRDYPELFFEFGDHACQAPVQQTLADYCNVGYVQNASYLQKRKQETLDHRSYTIQLEQHLSESSICAPPSPQRPWSLEDAFVPLHCYSRFHLFKQLTPYLLRLLNILVRREGRVRLPWTPVALKSGLPA